MSSAEQLGHELRFGSDDVLQRHRMVVALTLLTPSSMGMQQSNCISYTSVQNRNIPEGRGPNSEAVYHCERRAPPPSREGRFEVLPMIRENNGRSVAGARIFGYYPTGTFSESDFAMPRCSSITGIASAIAFFKSLFCVADSALLKALDRPYDPSPWSPYTLFQSSFRTILRA